MLPGSPLHAIRDVLDNFLRFVELSEWQLLVDIHRASKIVVRPFAESVLPAGGSCESGMPAGPPELEAVGATLAVNLAFS